MSGWSVQEQAARVAALLPDYGYVNLGIGMPGSVAAAVTPEQGIVFHCENGIIGYRALDEDEAPDADVIDAASAPVALIEGAAVVAHDISFAIARGGRLDATVLGAFQVSQQGDLANWKAPGARVAGVGGAMDLAVGARQVIVMMRHVDRDGNPKIVERCDYPLTVARGVDHIVTDRAVIAVTEDGLVVGEIAPGITIEELQAATGAPLRVSAPAAGS
ncbi:3-oxoacid CoA-transferase subunit B [Microbacterium tumbae]